MISVFCDFFVSLQLLLIKSVLYITLFINRCDDAAHSEKATYYYTHQPGIRGQNQLGPQILNMHNENNDRIYRKTFQ